MTATQFFRGFLAALRERQLEFVDTREDAHHRRFAAAVDVLQRAQAEHAAAAQSMPLALVPDPFTARFNEFDDALVRLQRGLLGAQNPYYPGIRITLSQERAHHVLDGFAADERRLLERLADAYLADGNGNAQGSGTPTAAA